MSASITTQQNHRVPLATALAIAGVIVAGGALGVAWQQSGDSTPAQATTLTPPTAQDYGQYNYYHGQNSGTPKRPGVQAPGPNSRSIERHEMFKFDAPTSGGRVQLGP